MNDIPSPETLFRLSNIEFALPTSYFNILASIMCNDTSEKQLFYFLNLYYLYCSAFPNNSYFDFLLLDH